MISILLDQIKPYLLECNQHDIKENLFEVYLLTKSHENNLSPTKVSVAFHLLLYEINIDILAVVGRKVILCLMSRCLAHFLITSFKNFHLTFIYRISSTKYKVFYSM